MAVHLLPWRHAAVRVRHTGHHAGSAGLAWGLRGTRRAVDRGQRADSGRLHRRAGRRGAGRGRGAGAARHPGPGGRPGRGGAHVGRPHRARDGCAGLAHPAGLLAHPLRADGGTAAHLSPGRGTERRHRRGRRLRGRGDRQGGRGMHGSGGAHGAGHGRGAAYLRSAGPLQPPHTPARRLGGDHLPLPDRLRSGSRAVTHRRPPDGAALPRRRLRRGGRGSRSLRLPYGHRRPARGRDVAARVVRLRSLPEKCSGRGIRLSGVVRASGGRRRRADAPSWANRGAGSAKASRTRCCSAIGRFAPSPPSGWP